MVSAINIALTGLDAASKHLDASASNIANLDTVGSVDGKPAAYTPVTAVQSSISNGGVQTNIIPKTDAFTPSYQPDSPFANQDGIVNVPNIDLAGEAVNLQLAKVAYKANAEVIKVAQDLDKQLLNAFDEKT